MQKTKQSNIKQSLSLLSRQDEPCLWGYEGFQTPMMMEILLYFLGNVQKQYLVWESLSNE